MGENFNHEDRALQLQWLQGLPLQGLDLRQSRRQGVPFLGWTQQEGTSVEAQPPQGDLDRFVQAQAQEGCRGGDHQKRTKRTHKFQRAIVGASLNEILAKRNQKPELRKAQRDEAIRAAKEVKKTKRDTKKTTAPKETKPKAKGPNKAAKTVQKAAPRVGGKR